MSARIDCPCSLDELFQGGEQQYTYYQDPRSGESDMDNVESLAWFLEYANVPEYAIIGDEGTLVELSHDDYERTLFVSSGGLGDTWSHSFETEWGSK